ncbi:SARP family transcriptional regulator [Actinorhabdospora filicis]|uniref:SARP family transcriptional regulator n=1 Tax=Actinorhabdospora filicis TaxID=1785913 RepID=A0A9W6SKW8_9ACTN|nr:BTAD domain-containing putative transcriptional regulator [Actinorhabdospora filicis]GLZ78123.1 SARP family transcriptional regulator [Actinorhabdospora filicis]
MRIRLIGPVEIHAEDRVIAVAAPKRACVLAALAERPGEPVAQTDLLTRVWGDGLPDSALGTLYSYITRLRADLAAAGLGIARAGVHGYVLEAAPEDVDLHAVRALAARATGLDAVRALPLWREACERAEGELIAGVPGEWADRLRTAFRGERLNLRCERYASELAAGNHALVLPELEALAAEEPFAEVVAELLMLALYRCGRAADALRVFEATRVRLRDALGADPSPGLREAHRRVLGQDPVLDASGQRAPNTLPAAVRGFTGRDAELSALDSVDSGLVVVSGTAGSGKTALAVHWGHSRVDFPGGRHYVNLLGYGVGEPVSPGEALQRLLTAMGRDASRIPADTEAATSLFRELTSRERTLVVLDNARHAAQVRPLLPGDGSLAVVTSRDRLPGLVALDGAVPVTVGTLSPRESRRLLRSVLGCDDVPELARLAELCGHLPLALRIAAANVLTGELGLAAYVAELESGDRLDGLAVEEDPAAAVATALGHSVTALDTGARELYLRLGVLPGEDFGRGLLEDVGGKAAIERLVAAHLLEEYQENRYRMHDLVRLYARRASAAMSAHDRFGAVESFVDWHHRHVHVSDSLDEVNVIAAASDIGDHPFPWRMLTRLGHAFNHYRHIDAGREAVAAARRRAVAENDDAGSFLMLNLLGLAARTEGDTEALLAIRQKLYSNRAGRRPQIIAMVTGNLGMAYHDADFRRAAELLAEATGIALTERNAVQAVNFGSSASVTLIRLGRFTEGEHWLDTVEAELDGDLNADQRAELRMFRATGLRYRRRHADALRAVEDGLAIAAGTEVSQRMQVHLRANRAAALSGLGRFDDALAAAEEAIALAEDHGMRLQDLHRHRAAAHAGLGDHHAALRALALADEHGTHSRYPTNMAALGLLEASIRGAMGDHAAALPLAARAAEVYGSVHCPLWRADALQVLAAAQRGAGDAEASGRSEREAAALVAGFDDPGYLLLPRGWVVN